MAYATVAQLQIRIQMRTTPTAAQNTMLEEILEAASALIDNVTNTDAGGFAVPAAAEARYFTAFGKNWLRIPRCTSISEVAVKASLTATTYTAWTSPTTAMAGDGDWVPARGAVEDPIYGEEPYDLLFTDVNGSFAYFLGGDGAPVVKVTAVWGDHTAVPADIRETCLMEAALVAKSYQGGQADSIGSPNFGQIGIRRALSKKAIEYLVENGRIKPLYGGR